MLQDFGYPFSDPVKDAQEPESGIGSPDPGYWIPDPGDWIPLDPEVRILDPRAMDFGFRNPIERFACSEKRKGYACVRLRIAGFESLISDPLQWISDPLGSPAMDFGSPRIPAMDFGSPFRITQKMLAGFRIPRNGYP